MEEEARRLRESVAPRSDRAIVATVLDLVAGLRADGFSWEDISGATERAGLRTLLGRNFSAERLRSYFGQLAGHEIVERIKSERAAAPAGPDAAKARATEPAKPASKAMPAVPDRALKAEPGGSADGSGDGKSLKERLLGADHPSNQPPKIIG